MVSESFAKNAIDAFDLIMSTLKQNGRSDAEEKFSQMSFSCLKSCGICEKVVFLQRKRAWKSSVITWLFSQEARKHQISQSFAKKSERDNLLKNSPLCISAIAKLQHLKTKSTYICENYCEKVTQCWQSSGSTMHTNEDREIIDWYIDCIY